MSLCGILLGSTYDIAQAHYVNTSACLGHFAHR